MMLQHNLRRPMSGNAPLLPIVQMEEHLIVGQFCPNPMVSQSFWLDQPAVMNGGEQLMLHKLKMIRSNKFLNFLKWLDIQSRVILHLHSDVSHQEFWKGFLGSKLIQAEDKDGTNQSQASLWLPSVQVPPVFMLLHQLLSSPLTRHHSEMISFDLI